LVYNKSEKVQMKLRFKQDKSHNWGKKSEVRSPESEY
jgi:hypothetical protein